MDAEALVRPVVESAGLELIEVTFNRGLLRVVVDQDGGVDIDTIAQTSEKVSRRLDLENFGSGRYTLEVSSPGVERHLREPRDFMRRIGERVKVKAVVPEEGGLTLNGTIVSADDEAVTIATDRVGRRVAYPFIRSARTVFEWGGQPKPGGRRPRAKEASRK
ncbi:MAG: ribosome maturation factor RimP [Actinomycetota bacterium]